MTAITINLLFASSIFILIILAGWYPFKKRQKTSHFDFPFGETIATGIFLGAALLHLLPEANSMFIELGYHYPFAYFITGALFLVFLWLEHIGKELYHHHDILQYIFRFLCKIAVSSYRQSRYC